MEKIIAISFFTISLLGSSCSQEQKLHDYTKEKVDDSFIVRPDLQNILDSAGVTGTILVYDPQSYIYFSNDFERSEQGYLPASTFKIPNSIIALETGAVISDTTIFHWNGEKRRLASWEKDLTFQQAFHASCVPCYQEVARKIGVERMNHYLKKFDYGNMLVDSTNLDLFWLEGDSKISAKQQIAFLKSFYTSQLGISHRTELMMKKMMVMDENPTYKLSGKTGWVIRNNMNIGWYVGYLEVKENVYYFAANVEPEEAFNMDLFPKIRTQIVLASLEKLGLMDNK